MIVSPDKDVVVHMGVQVVAPVSQSQNYVISSGASGITNYARWGSDLVVQFSSGQEIRINDFFVNGVGFHKLMLIDNGVRIDVDFSRAMTNTGDGIADDLIQYEQVHESISVSTLLGILGGVAVGAGGIYGAYSNNKSSSSGTDFKNILDPQKPTVDIFDDENVDDVLFVPNGGFTNDTTPTLAGEGAVPGGVITIYVSGMAPITVPVGADGRWSYTFSELGDGVYQAIITQTDMEGRVSDPTIVEFTVDTVAPDAPILNEAIDNVDPEGVIENHGSTNDSTPSFSGTAEANSQINIYVDGKIFGHGAVDASGNWAVELGENLADGEHRITITATDRAGNESAPSEEFVLTIDTAPPAALDVADITLQESHEDNAAAIGENEHTQSLRPVAKGVCHDADAAFVEVFDNGASIGRVKIGDDGSWRFVPAKDLALGSHNFSFEVIDAVGNRSTRTSLYQFIIESAKETEPTPDADDNSISEDAGHQVVAEENQDGHDSKADHAQDDGDAIVHSNDFVESVSYHFGEFSNKVDGDSLLNHADKTNSYESATNSSVVTDLDPSFGDFDVVGQEFTNDDSVVLDPLMETAGEELDIFAANSLQDTANDTDLNLIAEDVAVNLPVNPALDEVVQPLIYV